MRNVLLTAAIWPGAVFLIGGYINSVAIYYSSSRAIAFSIIVSVCLFMQGDWLILVNVVGYGRHLDLFVLPIDIAWCYHWSQLG